MSGRDKETVAPFSDGNQLGCHKHNSAVGMAFSPLLEIETVYSHLHCRDLVVVTVVLFFY